MSTQNLALEDVHRHLASAMLVLAVQVDGAGPEWRGRLAEVARELTLAQQHLVTLGGEMAAGCDRPA